MRSLFDVKTAPETVKEKILKEKVVKITLIHPKYRLYRYIAIKTTPKIFYWVIFKTKVESRRSLRHATVSISQLKRCAEIN